MEFVIGTLICVIIILIGMNIHESSMRKRQDKEAKAAINNLVDEISLKMKTIEELNKEVLECNRNNKILLDLTDKLKRQLAKHKPKKDPKTGKFVKKKHPTKG